MKDTLGNDQWVNKNMAGLKKLLPDTWTHVQNVNLMKFGFELKLLGVMWTDPNDLPKIMQYLERTGILIRDGLLIRANPNR
jgi:hypothetical protein